MSRRVVRMVNMPAEWRLPWRVTAENGDVAVRGGATVLAPLGIESFVLRRTTGVPVSHTGMGPARSSRWVEAFAEQRWTERGFVDHSGLLVAGVCGALSSDVRVGDVVVATEVLMAPGGQDGSNGSNGSDPGTRFECAGAPLIAADLARQGLRVHVGPIVSTTSLSRSEDRSRLASTGAIAVDMESAWLGPAAAGGSFAVIRAVTDGPDHGLTPLRPMRSARGGMTGLRALSRIGPTVDRWAAALAPSGRRILLAGPRSFCAGVERAVEIVERALQRHGPPVYVRKQIVHNVHVVRDLERRGAIFVDEVDDVPNGALTIFSAHGVSPEVRERARSRELRVIDATCPLVTKVHAEARRFARSGYTVFLVGHQGHEEVEGTSGEAPEVIRLIEPEGAAEDDGFGARIAGEVADPSRVAYLTQTTLAADDVRAAVGRLSERFPALVGPRSDDICYATQNRQDAVRAIARECDVLLVIGSENSSNSKRLVEVAHREGARAHLIDDERDIELSWLAGAGTLGLTAGASAPEAFVNRVIRALSGFGPVEVEQRSIGDEDVRFTLPTEPHEPSDSNGQVRASSRPGRS